MLKISQQKGYGTPPVLPVHSSYYDTDIGGISFNGGIV